MQGARRPGGHTRCLTIFFSANSGLFCNFFAFGECSAGGRGHGSHLSFSARDLKFHQCVHHERENRRSRFSLRDSRTVIAAAPKEPDDDQSTLDTSLLLYLVIAVLVGIGVIVVIVLVCYYRRRMKKARASE